MCALCCTYFFLQFCKIKILLEIFVSIALHQMFFSQMETVNAEVPIQPRFLTTGSLEVPRFHHIPFHSKFSLTWKDKPMELQFAEAPSFHPTMF